MPTPLLQTTRFNRYFTVSKLTAKTALNIPEVPLEWAWEGMGRNGILLARISSITEANTPIPNITRVTERWIMTPFEDIRTQWFSSYPPTLFDRLGVSFDTNNIVFDLNIEEGV